MTLLVKIYQLSIIVTHSVLSNIRIDHSSLPTCVPAQPCVPLYFTHKLRLKLNTNPHSVLSSRGDVLFVYA